jgi:hypothetical protein
MIGINPTPYPIFYIDSESEMDSAWPNLCGVVVSATGKYYKLRNGQFVEEIEGASGGTASAGEIDGGSASSTYQTDQIIDCGGA